MRSTKDLIEELSREASGFSMIGIAVGFEEETKFVFYKPDADLLTELNRLVQAGGEPIGLVGFLMDEDNRGAQFYKRPFDEHVGEEWVENYFDKLKDVLAVGAQAEGIRVFPAQDPERN